MRFLRIIFWIALAVLAIGSVMPAIQLLGYVLFINAVDAPQWWVRAISWLVIALPLAAFMGWLIFRLRRLHAQARHHTHKGPC